MYLFYFQRPCLAPTNSSVNNINGNFHILQNFDNINGTFQRVATRKSVDTDDEVKEGVQYWRIGISDANCFVTIR